ncbi:MAG: hypothetical protein QOF69_2323 [Solirubrobacteraceae bacterium]|nr:hypothetical protein [Solirubrobacteraceae bacterium]
MKTYALAVAAICVAMLALFGIAQVLDLPLLSSESPNLGTAGPGAAAASFALRAGDVLLPVPSSALMLLNGSLFGPIGGAALSLAGSEAAALLGWAIGRCGGPFLKRVVSPAARDRAEALVRDRGALAIVLTRPIPVVAETAAILAGAAGMPLRRRALAAVVGALPPPTRSLERMPSASTPILPCSPSCCCSRRRSGSSRAAGSNQGGTRARRRSATHVAVRSAGRTVPQSREHRARSASSSARGPGPPARTSARWLGRAARGCR